MATAPAVVTDERTPVRLWAVPLGSVLFGSLLALLPAPAAVPLLPSGGLLMLLGWRLRRPELWQAWIGLPLGLADDLIGGAPLGSAAVLWTLAIIAVDAVDHRILFRDRAEDWALAAALIAAVGLGAWGLSWVAGGAGPLWTAVPPATAGILCFPFAARICAWLDQLRLSRRRRPL